MGCNWVYRLYGMFCWLRDPKRSGEKQCLTQGFCLPTEPMIYVPSWLLQRVTVSSIHNAHRAGLPLENNAAPCCVSMLLQRLNHGGTKDTGHNNRQCIMVLGTRSWGLFNMTLAVYCNADQGEKNGNSECNSSSDLLPQVTHHVKHHAFEGHYFTMHTRDFCTNILL